MVTELYTLKVAPEPGPVDCASNHAYPVRRRYSLKDDSLSELSDQLTYIVAPVSFTEEILVVILVGVAGTEVTRNATTTLAVLESTEQPIELQARTLYS